MIDHPLIVHHRELVGQVGVDDVVTYLYNGNDMQLVSGNDGAPQSGVYTIILNG